MLEWQDRPSNGYLAEGSHDASAGTDLGRLCDDRADGLCAAGRAGVSAPPPLSLAGQSDLILTDASVRGQSGPRPTGFMIHCVCLASVIELQDLIQPGAPDDGPITTP
jgi:hypothetical protein